MDVALAVFVYNRLDKVASLRAALEEWHGPIRVYSDGPRSAADTAKVTEVRAEAVRFPGALTLVERERNLGLSANLRDGIKDTLARHEAVIVLEDDILPGPGCLDFLVWALEHAKGRPDIFSASAQHPLGDVAALPELFLSQRFFCWGWATWRDRWEKVEAAHASGQPPYRHYWEVPARGGDDLRWAVRSHWMGKKPITWAHLTSMLCLYHGWTHLCPGVPLAQNIGFDGSGENCEPGKEAPVITTGQALPAWRWDDSLERNPAIEARITKVFQLPPEPPLKKLRRYLSYRLRTPFVKS